MAVTQRPAIRAAAPPLVVTAVLLLVAAPTAAQQFVVDDAPVLEPGACQAEAWVGEASSWLLPSCRLLPRTEVSLGVGRISANGSTSTEWVLATKTNLLERPDGFGIGFVAGIGMDPSAGITSSRLADAWAYVPISVPLGDRLLLHANGGWHVHRESDDHDGHDHDHGHGHGHTHHDAAWGVRADVAAATPFVIIGELFGAGRTRPQYQVGLRTAPVHDRLAVDLTWGGHTATGFRGAGWTLGAAWTPPPWF